MLGEPLDTDMIVSATEEMLRRHGPEETTVFDVARLPGVSRGSVYRPFSSQAAPREAVIRRCSPRSAPSSYGIASGDFATGEPEVTARALFTATSRFREPAHAAEWQSPGVETELVSLLLDGIRAR